jgi:hypothetical protein
MKLSGREKDSYSDCDWLWLEQLIATFSNTYIILTLKLTNFAEWKS